MCSWGHGRCDCTVLARSLQHLLSSHPSLPARQRLLLNGNKLTGVLPPAWASGFPQLRELALQENQLAGTLPPGWVAPAGYSSPFVAALQPGNALLCGAFQAGAGHTVEYRAPGLPEHELTTTLGSCASDGCGSATVNASAPNLYDQAWANRAAPLDLEAFNPTLQQNFVPKQGSPVSLPCYPSNPPTFFGGDAAYLKAAWQSSTEGGRDAGLPVLAPRGVGNRQISEAECSMTADAPAYWVVDLQREISVLVSGGDGGG